jgi:serine/threonine-protein kinase PpkA
MNRIRTLGQGGLGFVSLYQATNGQHYAVKQMLYQWDDNHYERLKREIEIMENLVHKNIVRVINFDVLNNTPWYLMPFYKDGSLRDRLLDLRSKGQVYSVKGASGIIYHLADAFRHAHNNGVIHRDLKPENILFNGKEPMLADWGIGKFIHKESKILTYGGLGTKSYCSPEQWNNGVSDNRSDIYSLGLIYRELLTGSLIGQIQDQRINTIVNRMTLISPNDRYKSMDEVMKDISALNEISTDDPMKDFWEGAIIVGTAIGIFYVLEKLLGD